jgi:acyl-coenzyme A thioesterase PaaI-like protein
MPTSAPSPGTHLRALWRRVSHLPAGRWLFSRVLGFMVPYTGRLGARVVAFEPGHVIVELRERRAVRNHLASVHAMALANAGELATGLAVLGGLPATVRGILTGFDIEFRKKARGRLLVESRCEVPEVAQDEEYLAVATISDEAGDTVAVARARWRLGPVPEGGG